MPGQVGLQQHSEAVQPYTHCGRARLRLRKLRANDELESIFLLNDGRIGSGRDYGYLQRRTGHESGVGGGKSRRVRRWTDV